MATAPAGSVSSELVLRILSLTEVGTEFAASVYDDGHILNTDPTRVHWMLQRRLTDGGIERLRQETVATGLFATDATYAPIPLPGAEPPGRGGSGGEISVRRDDGVVVVVSWVSPFWDDSLYFEPSPERQRLDELLRHLLAFESWLTPGDWAEPQPRPFRAERFRVFIHAQPWGGALDALPPDIAEVAWPLGGPILAWGEPLSPQAGQVLLPGEVARCGAVSRTDAEDLHAALLQRGAATDSFAAFEDAPNAQLRLGDRGNARIVTVYFEPLIPDEIGCEGAPLPGGFGFQKPGSNQSMTFAERAARHTTCGICLASLHAAK